VTKVEYLVNPPLVKAFEKKRLELAGIISLEATKPILCFHGTSDANIENIIQNNFDISKVGSSTDSGYYGAGIYFSEFPSLSMAYVRGCSKFLLCQVILGKTFKCTTLIHGQPCKTGYNSHISPCGKEIVIFDTNQILPYYIVHYKVIQGGQDFYSEALTTDIPAGRGRGRGRGRGKGKKWM